MDFALRPAIETLLKAFFYHLLWIVVSVAATAERLARRISRLWRRCIHFPVQNTRDESSRRRNKRVVHAPTTVGIALTDLAPDHLVPEQLIKVVRWCLHSGFLHILIYDAAGHAQKQCEKLQQLLREAYEVTGQAAPNVAWKVGFGAGQPAVRTSRFTSRVASHSTGLKNQLPAMSINGVNTAQGYSNSVAVVSNGMSANVDSCDDSSSRGTSDQQDAVVDITLISPAEVHWPLLAAARWGPRLLQEDSSPATSSAASLRQSLLAVADPAAVLEPELLLVFGSVFTLGGYPPWQLRFTELYFMGQLRHARIPQLELALKAYLQTDQRFGT